MHPFWRIGRQVGRRGGPAQPGKKAITGRAGRHPGPGIARMGPGAAGPQGGAGSTLSRFGGRSQESADASRPACRMKVFSEPDGLIKKRLFINRIQE